MKKICKTVLYLGIFSLIGCSSPTDSGSGTGNSGPADLSNAVVTPSRQFTAMVTSGKDIYDYTFTHYPMAIEVMGAEKFKSLVDQNMDLGYSPAGSRVASPFFVQIETLLPKDKYVTTPNPSTPTTTPQGNPLTPLLTGVSIAKATWDDVTGKIKSGWDSVQEKVNFLPPMNHPSF